MDCPTREDVKAYREGTLSLSTQEELESHIASCESCAAIWEQISTELGGDHFLEALKGVDRAIFDGTVSPGPARSNQRAVDLWCDNAKTNGQPTNIDARFRIIRHHARGGLGEVYLAFDLDLKREVALKQIQTRYAHDAQSRARFLREAEITGALEHPGVVPIYALGRDSDAQPYYAMRFLEGGSLATYIETVFRTKDRNRSPVSTDYRRLVSRLVQVANAVDYAHSKGVLHRDLKPSNVMLGEHGETIVVDWGLAKRLDHTDGVLEDSFAAGEGLETKLGQAMGTPAYMSPEQAVGDLHHVGPSSDVYSLGAILYVMLTGVPPFAGGDMEEILGNVESGQFPAPRSLNRTAPRPLESICLRAMHRDPAERYPSAAEFARDLENWLSDQQVASHAESFTEKTSRWMRRNRSWTLAIAVTLVVLTVSTSLALIVVNLARKRERSARLAEVESRQAERKTVNEFTTLVANDDLLNQPGMLDLRRRLLEKSRDYYESARNYPFRSELELAQSQYNWATIQDKIDATGAYDEFTSALETLERCHNGEANDLAAGRLLVSVLLRLSSIELDRDSKSIPAALKRAHRAKAIANHLVEADPSNRILLLEAAAVEVKLAGIYDASSFPDREEKVRSHFAQADRFLDRIPAGADDRDLLLERSRIARGLSRVSDYEPSVKRLKETLALLEDAGGDLILKLEQIAVLERLGNVHWRNQEFDAASRTLVEAIDRLSPWAYVHPNDVTVQMRLADLYDYSAYTSHQAWREREDADPEELESAVSLYERGREIYERLGDSNNNRHLVMWNNIYNGLGLVERDRERYLDSEQWFDKAINLLNTSSATDSRPARLKRQTLSNYARTMERQGKYDEALKLMNRAATIARKDLVRVSDFAPTLLNRADCQVALYLQMQDDELLDSACDDLEFVRVQTSKRGTHEARFFFLDASLKKARICLLAGNIAETQAIADEIEVWLERFNPTSKAESQLMQSTWVRLGEVFAISADVEHAHKSMSMDQRIAKAMGILSNLKAVGFFKVEANQKYLDRNSQPPELSTFELRRRRYCFGEFAYTSLGARKTFRDFASQLDTN